VTASFAVGFFAKLTKFCQLHRPQDTLLTVAREDNEDAVDLLQWTIICRDSWPPGRDSNSDPSEHEAETLNAPPSGT